MYQAQSELADKGYDSNAFVSFMQEQQMRAVIPPTRNRTERREYDESLYKDRNLVERFFSRIKHFRRI
ncbi:transposase [Undibacterium sp. FT31W]|uniref:Transposase n=1 Tax=Undibacterium griseum TaxID=2762295 RepID=A0ABR6YS23_9BURK|nr:transposase [Undibacterium griseum]